MTNKTNNKVIAKNTIFLYVRMFVILLIKLYTTRVLLQVLGTDDFGIWNVVYGSVIAFSFVNAPIITATQRYLNYDEGRGGINQSRIFSTSLILTSAASLLLIIFLESVGLNFIKDKLEIPTGAELGTQIIYHCCVGILVINFIRVPFESIIISHERFSFYALISFIEAALLLGIIILLKFWDTQDSLQLYGIFTLTLSILLFIIYVLFCRFKFKDVKFETKLDIKLVKEIGKFAGWNLFGAISAMLATQGINVLFNLFYGVAVNAAYGISMQVTGAFILMASNLIKAANPRIVKNYAMGNIDEMMNITLNISKYAFLLIFSISYILMNFMNLVLTIWLGNIIPTYTNIFCIFSIIYILIVCLSSPSETVVFAIGDIKKYQIIISSVLMLNFVFAYISLKLGMSPIAVLIIKICVELLVLLIRMIFIKKKIKFSITKYFNKTILPSLLLIAISCISMGIFKKIFCLKENIHDMIAFTLLYIPIVAFTFWYLYLSHNNRKEIINKIYSALR